MNEKFDCVVVCVRVFVCHKISEKEMYSTCGEGVGGGEV